LFAPTPADAKGTVWIRFVDARPRALPLFGVLRIRPATPDTGLRATRIRRESVRPVDPLEELGAVGHLGREGSQNRFFLASAAYSIRLTFSKGSGQRRVARPADRAFCLS
jgi:hypothetical protein